MRLGLLLIMAMSMANQVVADYHESYGDIFSTVIEQKTDQKNVEVLMSGTHLLENQNRPKLRMQQGQFYKITHKNPALKLSIQSFEDEVNAQALVEELEVLGIASVHYVVFQLHDYPDGYGKRYMVKAGPFSDQDELQRSEDELVRNGYFYMTEAKGSD